MRRATTSFSRQTFEAALGFEPDRFQVEALDALDADHSVLVAAPTGAGKTLVAEYAVADALARGGKAFYTTPIKALSNQKFRDLSRAHGPEQVGLLTGDNSINGDARIVVMTTEVLRNMIYSASSTLDGLEVVMLDEVHYLQDPYRGAVWEEVIIHLDPFVRLVCLSATVSNAEEFGDWLSTVRGNTEVVIEEERPVELEQRYVVELRDADELMIFPTFVTEKGRRIPNPVPSDYDPRGPARRGRRPPPKRRGMRPVPPDRIEVVGELADREMLPAIWFIFSRAGCDEAARQCRNGGLRLTTAAEAEEIRAIVDRHLRGLSASDLDALGVPAWLERLEAGLASHHAGLVPPMKEAVEEAFTAGLAKVVFATETLALGINMPARSVVIERLTKFTGERHEMLTPGQYTQLTGRAGRRGIDEVGYGVVLWNRWTTFDQVASLASRRTYELTSSFRPTYNMAVNLVRRHSRSEAHHLLNLSFAQYRVDRQVVNLERRAEESAQRLAETRDRARCERGDVVEYVRLVEQREQLRREGSGSEVEDALARLRPGDIVKAGRKHGTVVVVQRGSGRGGSPRVTALDNGGRSVRLGASSFRRPPAPVGHVELPEPHRPKNPGFRKEAVRRLRQADTAAEPRTRSEREERLGALDAEIEAHPVAACPDVNQHLDALRRVRSLEREERRAQERVEARADTLSRHLDRVLGLLEDRGYADDWQLTG